MDKNDELLSQTLGDFLEKNVAVQTSAGTMLGLATSEQKMLESIVGAHTVTWVGGHSITHPTFSKAYRKMAAECLHRYFSACDVVWLYPDGELYFGDSPPSWKSDDYQTWYFAHSLTVDGSCWEESVYKFINSVE